MSSLTTRLFKISNSQQQAVRIPQESRLDTTQVEISRNADGVLVIHPFPVGRGAALLDTLINFDEDFVNALEQNYQKQPAMQDRETL